jgi:hypothetical protein
VYPVFSGWTYDTTGSYASAFIIVGLQALSIVMFFAKKSKPPANAVYLLAVY